MPPTTHHLPRVALHDEHDPHPAPLLAVTINSACRISGLGRTSIYEAISAGRLGAVKSGARTLVLMDSLRSYLAGLPRVGGAKSDLSDPFREGAR